MRVISVTALTLLVAAAVAGCGSEEPSAPGAQAPASMVPSAQAGGATAMIAAAVEVINARIPQPRDTAGQAQLEMTLAVTTPGPAMKLTGVSTSAAASTVLLVNGKQASQVSIPGTAGTNVQIGPPAADEILLTGLRRKLRLGQSVQVTISFGTTGSGTLNVPVTVAP
jgi:copper(I)-binding protein